MARVRKGKLRGWNFLEKMIIIVNSIENANDEILLFHI
jgi:hypothetical protein